MKNKGKYASATENRRFTWEEVVWPLVLELDDVSFTKKQFQKKRNEVAERKGLPTSKISGGFVSLLQKGILYKEKELYSIHYRIIAYLRVRADCDYATAAKEASAK